MLFDHLGSAGIPGYKDMLKKLAATEIQWHPMLPIMPLKGKFRRPDLRNHRKLLVVDGQVGFTGSQNLTEPGYNKPKNHEAGREWVELMVRLQGPVVAALDAVFAERLVHRDRRDARRGGRAGAGRADAERAARRRRASWCRAARASWPRTTCGCSPR